MKSNALNNSYRPHSKKTCVFCVTYCWVVLRRSGCISCRIQSLWLRLNKERKDILMTLMTILETQAAVMSAAFTLTYFSIHQVTQNTNRRLRDRHTFYLYFLFSAVFVILKQGFSTFFVFPLYFSFCFSLLLWLLFVIHVIHDSTLLIFGFCTD